MLKNKILPLIIVLVCILVLSAIIFNFEESHASNSSDALLNPQENKDLSNILNNNLINSLTANPINTLTELNNNLTTILNINLNNAANISQTSININSTSESNQITKIPGNRYILMIPKMRITGKIRSNTVNGYNTVYHYSQSVNPGQSGECGLLSHRTKYSGLFSKLCSLEAGDEVIITDYLLHKKYVYIVTSNGNDIRWNYKKKPLTFAQSGDAKLLLITCYPPGKSEAAFITHCKLVSTTILAN